MGVGEVWGTVAAAMVVFVGTDIDDIIVLTVLFLAARSSGRPRRWQIWTGQYLGVGVLVLVSALAALGLAIVPDRWVGLLGLIPFALGLRGLVAALRSSDPDQPAPVVAAGLTAVVGVTLANGADNIAVYTPMFRTLSLGASLLTVGVFAIGIAVWCLAGSWLGSHPRVIALVERSGRWLVPVVFMLIGVAVVVESDLVGGVRF